MITYILMKILEASPERYDRGIFFLTHGRLDKVCDSLASMINKGDMVLDIGCGTGALSLRAARMGARVRGIDINPRMLEVARIRAEKANLSEHVEFLEMGVAELGTEESLSFDVVMSVLCFSELKEDEISFALREARRILKPGGLLLIADEVKPRRIYARLIGGLFRLFLKALVLLIYRSTTGTLKEFPDKVRKSGFQIESLKMNNAQNFIELVARKQESEG